MIRITCLISSCLSCSSLKPLLCFSFFSFLFFNSSFGVTLFKYSWLSLLCAPTAEFLIKLSKEIQYGPEGYYHKGQLPLIGSGHTERVITSKHRVFTFSFTCGLEQAGQMRLGTLTSAFEAPKSPRRRGNSEESITT